MFPSRCPPPPATTERERERAGSLDVLAVGSLNASILVGPGSGFNLHSLLANKHPIMQVDLLGNFRGAHVELASSTQHPCLYNLNSEATKWSLSP